MAHRTYLTLLVATAGTESAFTQITCSGVGYVREVLIAFEAALSCYPLLNLRSHFTEGKLFVSLLLYLTLKIIQVIAEADNDQCEIILAGFFHLVQIDTFFQNCLRYFPQGHILGAKF